MNRSTPLPPASGTTDALASDSVLMTVMGALALVVMLLVALAWIVRRSGLARRLNDSHGVMSVVASKSLGARERLVLVDVGDQRLVLGVTTSQITCLTTQPRPVVQAAPEMPAPLPFPALLEKLRQKYRQDPES
ncbi:flagellar biosynthetic protein FliO [Scandinavium goeteborgense]|uniref:Flagellar protein n=1 Tax=Scandinavium goeteborgense TaxID=1851514 RepID=A0A4R6EKS4_SCAGO|nr:flagellar biosynthetic protein FliO [Scandinavium goeteborgense]TDN59430.1 flagellar protein FliO/FliZ [Scandinavium goeteborgense]